MLSTAFNLLVAWAALSSAAPWRRDIGPRELVQEITVLEYSPATAYAKIEVLCPSCFDAEGDESLVFDLQVTPSQDLSISNLVVDTSKHGTVTELLYVPNSRGLLRPVQLSWASAPNPQLSPSGADEHVTRSVHFSASPDQHIEEAHVLVGFTVIMRPTSQTPLAGLVSNTGFQVIDFSALEEDRLLGSPEFANGVYDSEASTDVESFDLGGELESLALLENKARELQLQIAAKKQAIATNVRQEREKLCLKHLVQECDGIICAAKAVIQRLCDKVGIPTTPSLQYAHFNNKYKQHMVGIGSKVVHKEGVNAPLMFTNKTSSFAMQPIDIVYSSTPFVKAFQIMGAALGLTALFLFLKRQCMSMRRRVERAADLEERRTRRAYRRAARRALVRERWTTFFSAINCFGRKAEPHSENYEEKRALILQDAFLEQDLDAAEKGEIMEAEIRELRYAHDIVSSLVDHGCHRTAHLRDPPPPLVPLPRTPGPRSRASTYTLPSYTSETLPDYSSQPEDTDGSNSLVDGYTPSISEEQGRQSPVSPVSEFSSGRVRYTPTSSIRETSTRPSGETLRTWMSMDTGDEYTTFH